MPGKRIIDQDMSGIGSARHGSTMAMVGKILLWMDLLLLAFVYVGLRSGSHMWAYWVLGQGILGFALLGFGMRRRAREMRHTSRDPGQRAA
jgi:hypothetical protein